MEVNTFLHPWQPNPTGLSDGWDSVVFPESLHIVLPDFFEFQPKLFLGFSYLLMDDGWEVAVPYWFLILILSIALFFVWRKTGKRK